jgi:hypothetical protein
MENERRMEFTYKKDDNRKLFKSLEENPAFGILQAQNYNPLYNTYFALTKANCNTIGLNHKWKMHEIVGQETNNIFKGQLKDDKAKAERKVYLKFSPLLDPIKYLLGKYDSQDATLLNLPAFESEECNPKARDYNNSAYVDSFFTYLSSKLLHDHGFVHGMDFYGSFLAVKTDFRINIIDDIEYLNDSAFFRKNDKVLYELEENGAAADAAGSDTRNYRKKLNFAPDDDTIILQLSDISDLKEIDDIVQTQAEQQQTELAELVTIELPDIEKTSTKSSKNSSCSSRSSNTSAGASEAGASEAGASEAGAGASEAGAGASKESKEEDVVTKNTNEEDWESASEAGASEAGASEAGASEAGSSSSTSEAEEEELIAKIKKFPVQVIAMEHCETTIDEFMMNEEMTSELWDSIVLQILFSLITFQNAFGLTHNDLHTNNIMYIETDKKFLYYKLNHVYYKVPTFGKLFKIIDYGRAIYKFRGQLLCSDSYHPTGDAATQYNCEPYFNDKKPRLDPNFGFDLCRLGCALYDYLEEEPQSKIVQIMMDWVKDDKGRNILYKKNGDERYPDFKLYKMIARTANKHVPANVLSNPYFDKYIIAAKEAMKKKVMDLDAIPSYM